MQPGTSQILSFYMGEQLFALEITSIQEVIEWDKLEPVPFAPEFTMGVINYHGRVIMVVDLAVLFGEPSEEQTENTRVVVLAGEDMSLGFKVDSTYSIDTFDQESIRQGVEQAPEKGYIKAVVKFNGKLYNLIDLERLLESIEEIFEKQAAR